MKRDFLCAFFPKSYSLYFRWNLYFVDIIVFGTEMILLANWLFIAIVRFQGNDLKIDCLFWGRNWWKRYNIGSGLPLFVVFNVLWPTVAYCKVANLFRHSLTVPSIDVWVTTDSHTHCIVAAQPTQNLQINVRFRILLAVELEAST